MGKSALIARSRPHDAKTCKIEHLTFTGKEKRSNNNAKILIVAKNFAGIHV